MDDLARVLATQARAMYGALLVFYLRAYYERRATMATVVQKRNGACRLCHFPATLYYCAHCRAWFCKGCTLIHAG